MTFLHGVETISLKKGPRQIEAVRTAVVGIIGTAPIHAVDAPPTLNEAQLVLTDRDASNYGSTDYSGYTLPRAIKAVQDHGAGVILAINVFDPATMRTTVAAASKVITDGAIDLALASEIATNGPLLGVTVTTSADAACVEDTDYEVDLTTGIITIIEGGALDGEANAKVAYVKANPAAVVADDIIGEVADGVRIGAQAFLDCAVRFGFKPKILLAPGFEDATVTAALLVLAQKTKLRALVLTDVPAGTVFADVLEGRGPSGTVDLTASDKRLAWCWPMMKISATEVGSFAARIAGVIARTDSERGYWVSPSNQVIAGIVGTDQSVQASISDPNAETNLLNAAGIITVYADYGVPARVWGNRSSVYPGDNSIESFIACLRTFDVVEESVEIATLRYLDGPVGDVLIEAVLSDVNAFMRTLISRGALVTGSRIEYFAEDNTSEELAAGHITFTYTYCVAPPAEKITYKAVVDTTLLSFGG